MITLYHGSDTDGTFRIKRFESLKWKECTYQYCFISEESIKQLKVLGTI